jgi:Condensation domain
MKRGSKGDFRRCPSSSHSSTAITHTGSVKSSAAMARTTKKRLAGGRNTFSETQVGSFHRRAKFLRSDGSGYQRAIAWWKNHFRKEPARLELPFRRPRPLTGIDPSEGTIDWPVELELEERLDLLSRSSGRSLFSVWLAALGALLAIESGQSDIVIGTYMTSRRRHPSLSNMIGCFANLVALRFQCEPARLFSDWLSDVSSLVAAAQERCEIPHTELSNVLQALGVLNRNCN